MLRRAAVLPLLLGSACSSGDCEPQDEGFVFVLDPEHPQLLVSVSADAPVLVDLGYEALALAPERGWEVDGPCRVAIYNYGSDEVAEPWPAPGDPPSPGVRIDRDFNLTADDDRMFELSEWLVQEQPGPVTANLVVSSCGTATVRGALKVSGRCTDVDERDAGLVGLGLVTRRSPDE